MTKRAEMGIGTLILFIALMFVATTAAAVLIQTSSTLQNKAYTTGSQTIKQTLTSVVVIEASAVDGRNALENVSFTVKLSPGADSLDIDSMSISLNTQNSSTFYLSSESSSFSINSSTSGEFGYTYLQQGTSYKYGLLSRGDLILITISSPQPIEPGEITTVRFLPREGLPVSIGLYTPDVYTTNVVHLYP